MNLALKFNKKSLQKIFLQDKNKKEFYYDIFHFY